MMPFFEQNRAVRINRQGKLDFPLHIHDAVEMVYVLAGSSTVIWEGRRQALGPGDLFLCFPGQVHGYESTQDFDGFLLVAGTTLLSDCKAMLEKQQPAQPVIHPPQEAAGKLRALLEMMHADRKNANPSLLRGYSLVLLNKLVALTGLVPRSADTDALQAVLRYISLHYRENITRRDICRAVGYSESYISHLFTRQMQVSLWDYITDLRLDDARQQLKATDLPVGQIALSLGFPSVRSFNRCFSQRMHMTPSQYRQR